MVDRVRCYSSCDNQALITFLDDPFELPYILELRPSSDFAYESAKNKLAGLHIGTDGGPQVTFVIPGDNHAADDYDGNAFGEPAGRRSQMLRLSGWIALDSKITVSSDSLHDLELFSRHVPRHSIPVMTVENISRTA